jgi:hypothetical protein
VSKRDDGSNKHFHADQATRMAAAARPPGESVDVHAYVQRGGLAVGVFPKFTRAQNMYLW